MTVSENMAVKPVFNFLTTVVPHCFSPTPSCIRVVMGLAIITYPISIHRKANNLMNLIQQHFLGYIIPYASHHLLQPKSTFVYVKWIWEKQLLAGEGNEENLLVGIEIIRSSFICPYAHTDPYVFLWNPWTFDDLPRERGRIRIICKPFASKWTTKLNNLVSCFVCWSLSFVLYLLIFSDISFYRKMKN